MPDYRRAWCPGGTYFFTVNLLRRRGERGIWERRYWEHLIRNEADFAAHTDYVHFNPVKHRLMARVAEWPFSTFHRLVREGIYPRDWAGSVAADEVTWPD